MICINIFNVLYFGSKSNFSLYLVIILFLFNVNLFSRLFSLIFTYNILQLGYAARLNSLLHDLKIDIFPRE